MLRISTGLQSAALVLTIAGTAAQAQGIVTIQKLSAVLANELVGESVARLGSIRRAGGVGGGRIPSGCLRLQSRRGSGRLVAAGAVRRVIAGRRGGVRG